MTYTATLWSTGDTITASKLNNMETGISEASSQINALDASVQSLEELIEGYDGREETFTFSSLDSRLVDGRVHYSDGVIEGTGTGYFLCAEIDIIPGYQVSFTPDNTGSYQSQTYANQFGYAFYSASNTYISGASGTVDQLNTVTAPSGAYKFRYGRNKDKWDIEEYSTITIKAPGGRVSSITWNAVGDSITANGQYLEAIRTATGLVYTKLGVHGGSVAINANAVDGQSMVERIPTYNDADIWTVFGGVNDVYCQSPLGALAAIGSTYDTTTVYGAYQALVENILGRRNHPRLLLITPAHSREDEKTKANNGITVAEVVKAIEDVGELYGVPVVNMQKLGGLNAFNWEHSSYPTTVDRLHPNDNGGAMMAAPIVWGMKMLLYDLM